jgi:hypothetical protein
MHRLMIVAIVSCLGSTAVSAGDVRLTVEEPAGVARQQWPVTSGIPFTCGALRDDQAAALFDAAGQQVPLQTEVLVRWPDGSIRWLLLDFQIDLVAREKKVLTLRYGPEIRRAAVDKPVKVTRAADGKMTIATGPTRLEYDPARFMPQGTAWITTAAGLKADERLTVNCGSDGVGLEDEEGKLFAPHHGGAPAAEMTIEQAGPIRACLHVRGWHYRAKDRMFQYRVRIHAWRGQPWIRVHYTFVDDLQDALMARIRKLEIKFWTLNKPEVVLLNGKALSSGRLFQVDDTQYLIDGKPAGQHA